MSLRKLFNIRPVQAPAPAEAGRLPKLLPPAQPGTGLARTRKTTPPERLLVAFKKSEWPPITRADVESQVRSLRREQALITRDLDRLEKLLAEWSE